MIEQGKEFSGHGFYLDCTCYLGQNGTLCKHMVAVAIYGLKKDQSLTNDEKSQHNEITFNGKIGEITQAQLDLSKAEIMDGKNRS